MLQTMLVFTVTNTLNNDDADDPHNDGPGNLDRFGWSEGELFYVDHDGVKRRLGEIPPEVQEWLKRHYDSPGNVGPSSKTLIDNSGRRFDSLCLV